MENQRLNDKFRVIFLAGLLFAAIALYLAFLVYTKGVQWTSLYADPDRATLCQAVTGCKSAKATANVNRYTGVTEWEIELTLLSGSNPTVAREQVATYIGKTRMHWVANSATVSTKFDGGRKG